MDQKPRLERENARVMNDVILGDSLYGYWVIDGYKYYLLIIIN